MLRKLLKHLSNVENNFYILIFKIKWYLDLIEPATDVITHDRELTFHDDFNSPTIDRSKWTTQYPWGRRAIVNEVNSFITDGSNISMRDSIAKFIVKEQSGETYDWMGHYDYDFTVPVLTTEKKFEQLYGRFDAKIKVSNNKRVWPAFWLLNQTYQCNYNGENKGMILPEIDIMEHFGGEENKVKNMQFTYHCGIDYNHETKIQYPTKLTNIDLSKDFFIYTVEWSKNKIVWKINDQIVKVHRYWMHNDFEIASHPMYIILNVAINGEDAKIYKDELPDGMEVDWITVYK